MPELVRFCGGVRPTVCCVFPNQSHEPLTDVVKRLADIMQPTDENWEERVKAMKTLQVAR